MGFNVTLGRGGASLGTPHQLPVAKLFWWTGAAATSKEQDFSDVDDVDSCPRGSKYTVFEDSGPKNHTLNGFWDQSPYKLGTWPLWVCELSFFAGESY